MTKVDIISGFLGAGKTTLIKKLLSEAFVGDKLVLIENEFGEVSVDGGFLRESGVQVSELSSGCICCTLVGDFTESLKQVYEQYQPDRILIEPSGVAKLSDVVAAIEDAVKAVPELKLNSFVDVVDATKVKVYLKNIPEYSNQVESAGTIVLSRTQKLTQEKLEAAVTLLREKNAAAAVITTPWDELEGKTILKAIEGVPMHDELLELVKEAHEHQHEHELEDEEEEHEHHHHHDHDEDDDHDHHHEDEDDDHDHGHHHHDHDHGPDCACGCHDHEGHEHHHHHHHHHGDADETFQSWGKESPKPFSRSDVEKILDALDSGEYGTVLRAKGIVPDGEGGWLEFDFVPGERELRGSEADYTGRLCVIGSGLKEEKLSALFEL
ncbi:MAG: GTP-binding protein [Oscillospiraceae bacterium]|nr:GTP-binding protein [Oscillospiraceae bacterium]